MHHNITFIMEILDLYANSARLTKATNLNFKRYMYSIIDWDAYSSAAQVIS